MRQALAIAAVAGCYAPDPPTGAPCNNGRQCPANLVCSGATQTCELLDRDAPTIPPEASEVTGNGTPNSPYVSIGTRTSCADFLAAHPGQAGLDGTYLIETPSDKLSVYCDMTTDGRGWTLVARVRSTSLEHATVQALGQLTSPTQLTTAKLADATIGQLGYTRARFAIETLGTTYVAAERLDFAGSNDFVAPGTAAATVDGPYSLDFLTQTNCNSDCGINVTRPNISFGNNCGYQFYAAQGAPRPGMGCEGNHST
jgi:hypothetical protein